MADFYNTKLEHEIKEDYFDLLPDPILLFIFNKLLDAKSLCSCLLVSKRFAFLVTQVDSISIQFKPQKLKQPSFNSLKLRSGSSSSSKISLRNFISKFITAKPFKFLHQIVSKKLNSSLKSDFALFLSWIGSSLKNFNEIKSLELELPCHGGEIGINKTIPLLKWEAGFGKEMERCIILGANSIERREKIESLTVEGPEFEPSITDDELKSRIIWIISCLIASSLRHNLVKKMVDDCPKLGNLVISDGAKQGKLCMNAVQIKALRDSMKGKITKNPLESPSSSSETANSTMGNVGNFNLVMKLWYVKELELVSCGKVMKGATLVVFKPESGRDEDVSGDDVLSLMGSFERDEVFGEAAKELLKKKGKKVYRLEMNSF